MDIALQAVAQRQAQTSQALQVKFLKMQADAQKSVGNMLEAAVANAKALTAAGTGAIIDKSA